MEDGDSVDKKSTGTRTRVASAIYCSALLARLTGLKIGLDFFKRQFEHCRDIGMAELARTLGDLDIRTRIVPLRKRKVTNIPFPGIVELTDAEVGPMFAVVHKAQSDRVVLQKMGQPAPETISSREFLATASGQVMLFTNAGRPQSNTNTSKFGFMWFWKTLFKYSAVMREAMIASFFVQIFALATPLFFMVIIDKVFTHNSLSTLDVLVFAMVVIAVFDVVLNGVRTYLMSHTTNRVDLELGIRLFKHMMSLPLSYFESRRTGDTIARMREAETIRHFLTGSSLTLLIDLVFVFMFLIVMWMFSQVLTLIVICTLPIFFGMSMLMTPFMRSRLEDKHAKMDENQSFLVETIHGIETVKSGSFERQQRTEWEHRLADYSQSSFQSNNLSNLINQGTTFVSKALTIGLLYIGAKLVLAGDLSVGQLIALNMLASRVIGPIQRLAQIWQEFTGMRVSIKRLADILETPIEPLYLKNRTELPKISGTIKFENTCFHYPDITGMALNSISLSIHPGETIGIVGSTGSGKTTLVKLVQRLYVPTQGKVTIDGIDIVGIDGSWLRNQIGVVAQDYMLFNRTIKDNITLRNLDIEDHQVIAAAKLVGAHEMIMALPNGYDTQLNESGRGLSTGQRQSIALARAVVTDPAILILDEATSALDYESEQHFQHNFVRMTKNRTTIVIAHRLSTVRYADRIITLDKGQIVENGSPDRLLKSGGRFSVLHQIHSSVWGSDVNPPKNVEVTS